MRTRWLFALILMAPALAGCIGGLDDPINENEVSPTSAAGIAPAQTPLWEDPQFTPHPAFNFPTVNTLHHDLPEDVPKWWHPIDGKQLPAEITGVEHVAETTGDIPTGSGIALFGQLAIVSGNPSQIVDISDPTNPEVLSSIDIGTRDADTIAYPDGRLVAIFATGSGILPYFDITDPTDPQQLGELEPTAGTHNVAVVPGTPIVYNSNSGGDANAQNQGRLPADATGITEIFDLSEPETPVHVQDWQNGYGCHDITFWNSPAEDKYRAYCAGIQMTQIWDIADPVNPEVLVNVPVHHGNPDLPSTEVFLASFSHLAMVNQDASVLIVGDETGGGAAPGCDGPGYLGNLWFYDISDETSPEVQSWYSPAPPALTAATQDNAATCTAHFGRTIPAEDADMLAMAFYGGGVVILDFTDAANPTVVQQWNQGTNTWDVWYYNGYLFTGDIARGMDVLELTG